MQNDVCATPYCQNESRDDRTICSTCNSKKVKKNNPLTYIYNYHKQNAKRRGIEWNLTKQQFLKIWENAGKWEAKKNGEPWQLHRLEDSGAYSVDNVVIVKKKLHLDITSYENEWKLFFRYKMSADKRIKNTKPGKIKAPF